MCSSDLALAGAGELELIAADIDELPRLQELLPIRHQATELIPYTDDGEEKYSGDDAKEPAHGGLLSALSQRESNSAEQMCARYRCALYKEDHGRLTALVCSIGLDL